MPEYTFGSIKIDHQDETITIIPLKVYKVTKDESKWAKFYIVVVYKIKYINNSTKKEINTTIPYYLSDGHTNGMRADILFPFMTFNIRGDNTNCIYTDYIIPETGNNYVSTEGGILKFNIIKNIDMETIIKSIDKIYEANVENGESKLLEIEKENIEGYGVKSILPRIVNILDFIIAINSVRIIKYEESKLEYYRPVLKQGNELNWDAMFDISSVDEYIRTKRDDIYRKLLLEEMKSYIISFQKYMIKTLYKRYTPELITMKNFNLKLQMCNDMKVTELQKDNIALYADISDKLNTIINNEITNFFKKHAESSQKKQKQKLQEINIIEENLEEKMAFYEKLESILYEKSIFLDKDKMKLLEKNIESWNAKCYKKYMKYKIKYLALR